MGTLNFTAAYHNQIKEKVSIFKQMIDICEDIQINEYSISISELLIIFQAFDPSSKAMIAKESKTMRRKTKTLELYLILDYERIMQGTDPENLLHIKEVFLKGCETFLKPLKDFKYNEFETKIKELL